MKCRPKNSEENPIRWKEEGKHEGTTRRTEDIFCIKLAGLPGRLLVDET